MVLIINMILLYMYVSEWLLETNAMICYTFHSITNISDEVKIVLTPKRVNDNVISCYLTIKSYEREVNYTATNEFLNKTVILPAYCNICYSSYEIHSSSSRIISKEYDCFEYKMKKQTQFKPSEYFLSSANSIQINYSICEDNIPEFQIEATNPSKSNKIKKIVESKHVIYSVTFRSMGFFQVWTNTYLNSESTELKLHSFLVLDKDIANELYISKFYINVKENIKCQTVHFPQLYNYTLECELPDMDLKVVIYYRINSDFKGLHYSYPSASYYQGKTLLSHKDVLSFGKIFRFGVFNCVCSASSQAPYEKWTIKRDFTLTINASLYDTTEWKNFQFGDSEILLSFPPILQHWIGVMFTWYLFIMIIFGLLCYIITSSIVKSFIKNTVRVHLNITQPFIKGSIFEELYLRTDEVYFNMNAKKLIDDIKMIRTMKLLVMRRKKYRKLNLQWVAMLLTIKLQIAKSFSYNDLEMGIVHPRNFTSKQSDEMANEKVFTLRTKLRKALRRKMKHVRRFRKSLMATMSYLKSKSNSTGAFPDSKTSSITSEISNRVEENTQKSSLNKIFHDRLKVINKKRNKGLSVFKQQKDIRARQKLSIGSYNKPSSIISQASNHPIQSKIKTVVRLKKRSRLNDQHFPPKAKHILDKSERNTPSEIDHESTLISQNWLKSVMPSMMISEISSSSVNITPKMSVRGQTSFKKTSFKENSKRDVIRNKIPIVADKKSHLPMFPKKSAKQPDSYSEKNSLTSDFTIVKLMSMKGERSVKETIRNKKPIISDKKSRYSSILANRKFNFDANSSDSDIPVYNSSTRAERIYKEPIRKKKPKDHYTSIFANKGYGRQDSTTDLRSTDSDIPIFKSSTRSEKLNKEPSRNIKPIISGVKNPYSFMATNKTVNQRDSTTDIQSTGSDNVTIKVVPNKAKVKANVPNKVNKEQKIIVTDQNGRKNEPFKLNTKSFPLLTMNQQSRNWDTFFDLRNRKPGRYNMQPEVDSVFSLASSSKKLDSKSQKTDIDSIFSAMSSKKKPGRYNMQPEIDSVFSFASSSKKFDSKSQKTEMSSNVKSVASGKMLSLNQPKNPRPPNH